MYMLHYSGQEITWGFSSGSIQIYNYRPREGARREGRQRRRGGRGEKVQPGASQTHTSSSPFSEAAARIDL